MVFQDQFFTKKDAMKLVAEQGIELSDEFELVHNKSMSAIGDYYHTFTLEISEQDKQGAISKIIDAASFETDRSNIDILRNQMDYIQLGRRIDRNYATQTAFIKEYFEPSGRQGYAPTFRRISISRTKNELIFEDIVE
ncbi:MAG: hypothetical protein IPL46_29970 [Saprospiraceae bacterium]|nr:hypothetical protein [Saprospiraceae bacterium]